MSFIPETSTNYNFRWTNYQAEDPALSSGYFASGPLVADGYAAALPVTYNYAGGYVAENLDLSPHAQHVTLFGSAPTLGDSYPGAVYPYNDITGTAFANMSYGFYDYSVAVSVPIKVMISYAAHVASFSPGNSQFEWLAQAASISPDGTRYTQLGSIGGNLINQHLSDSFTFTLAANSTLLLQGGLTASVGSIASTRNAYPTSTGLIGFLDAGNTGVLTVQELDALGNPIAGNPDLAFLSGANYLDAVAPPPTGVALPEPGTQLLVLFALPIVWLLSRRASRTAKVRDVPTGSFAMPA